ncbi:FecR family protein [Sphingomonas abaci]|uniref:Transmembrane sensor n=1 Tax=Sphingomonas abaci TaxID=237611 RepID=A0A7W7AHX8_9SPHN|nr:FecR domain-containing protein [Sphingomonas abaci]MBB4617171.1 transmembrane sensor [Sphingomonas abaci]
MIDELACRWAAAIDRGLVDDEPANLDAWLGEDRRHRGALLRAQAALSLLDRARALSGPSDDGMQWRARAPARAWRITGTAAAALLVAGAGIALWPSPAARIETSVGEVRRTPLSDGSIAVVNSGTRLRVTFTPGRRDVEVQEGEAWFQVAHNPARPFVVASGPVRVQAIGTAFDVRRLAGRSDIVVTRGVVKLWSVNSPDHAIRVAAGEGAVIDADGAARLRRVSAETTDQKLAWREGRIVLDDMTMGEAVAAFNRYNGDRLAVAPSLAGRRVVGWFRTDDVDGFATASAAMVGGRVERRNVAGQGEVTVILP